MNTGFAVFFRAFFSASSSPLRSFFYHLNFSIFDPASTVLNLFHGSSAVNVASDRATNLKNGHASKKNAKNAAYGHMADL